MIRVHAKMDMRQLNRIKRKLTQLGDVTSRSGKNRLQWVAERIRNILRNEYWRDNVLGIKPPVEGHPKGKAGRKVGILGTNAALVDYGYYFQNINVYKGRSKTKQSYEIRPSQARHPTSTEYTILEMAIKHEATERKIWSTDHFKKRVANLYDDYAKSIRSDIIRTWTS